MSTKTERAVALLEKARAAGCVPTIEGNFVVFRPPPPVALAMEAAKLGNELLAALK